MKKIYLSIDLDYFSSELDTKWLEKIITKSKSTKVVVSHEQLLSHINKCEFDTLVNVDFHSDLASHDGPPLVLDEGTWGNFVKKSSAKQFVWVPPSNNSLYENTGYCHGGYKNPFRYIKYSGWAKTLIKVSKLPKKAHFVGIAISPYWSNKYILKQFWEWHNKTRLLELNNYVKKTILLKIKD